MRIVGGGGLSLAPRGTTIMLTPSAAFEITTTTGNDRDTLLPSAVALIDSVPNLEAFDAGWESYESEHDRPTFVP